MRLKQKYPQEIEAILAKYPADQKRAAVMPLLYLAQRDEGYIKKQSLADIGEILHLSTTDVAGIVGFYTLYHEHSWGENTGYRSATTCPAPYGEPMISWQKLCENLGIKVGETTPDGLVTVEAVMCLAGCDRAPMFQVQTGEGLAYHENQTIDSALGSSSNNFAARNDEAPGEGVLETRRNDRFQSHCRRHNWNYSGMSGASTCRRRGGAVMGEATSSCAIERSPIWTYWKGYLSE
jgi:NADH-quinone oxidoreductase subunit E